MRGNMHFIDKPRRNHRQQKERLCFGYEIVNDNRYGSFVERTNNIESERRHSSEKGNKFFAERQERQQYQNHKSRTFTISDFSDAEKASVAGHKRQNAIRM